MNHISKSFLEIINDADATINSRKYKTTSGTYYFLVWNIDESKRMAFIQTENKIDLKRLPKWVGLETGYSSKITSVSTINGNFFLMTQIPSYDPDGSIFENVLLDLLNHLDTCQKEAINQIIYERLNSWDKSLNALYEKKILADNLQQGIFGELKLLLFLIECRGITMVDSWIASDKTDHDFALSDYPFCSIEVKTSNSKAPYKIQINNEYQLDNKKNISGELYLAFYAIERTTSEGETLPELIQSICDKFLETDLEYRELFEIKLMKQGYDPSLAFEYKTKFALRDKPYYYHITNSFPRLTRSNYDIPPCIGSITYELQLPMDKCWLLSNEEFKRIIMGEKI